MMEIAKHQLYIGGQWVEPSTGEHAPDLDPATNRPIAEIAVGGVEDGKAGVEAARAAFENPEWRGIDPSKRGRLLYHLGQAVRDAFEEVGRLESLAVGKPIREAKGDAAFVYKTLEYWAGMADKIQGETIPVPGARLDYTLLEPVGVTVHIAPWNYPLTLAVRGIAPALAAGNTVVLKPAAITPMTALKFAELAEKAGFPPGVVHESIHADFVKKVADRAAKMKLGPGLKEDSQMGPVVSPDQEKSVLSYVDVGTSEGAKLLVGGKKVTDGELAAGNFLAPAVFDGVAQDMRIAR